MTTALPQGMAGGKAKWPRIPYEQYRLRKQIRAKHGIDAIRLVVSDDGVESSTRSLPHDLWIVN